MAAGHRCSLRHNVCQPLRMRTHAYTNENLLALKIFTIDIFVSIFKTHNVVGGVVYYINDIYGGTLPVLKNEIKDFFFARLGTGGN